MADDIDLNFLGALLRRALEELGELRVGQATLSTDLKITKEGVADISDRLQIVEGRLNTIDSRLARIEKHTGLVKA